VKIWFLLNYKSGVLRYIHRIYDPKTQHERPGFLKYAISSRKTDKIPFKVSKLLLWNPRWRLVFPLGKNYISWFSGNFALFFWKLHFLKFYVSTWENSNLPLISMSTSTGWLYNWFSKRALTIKPPGKPWYFECFRGVTAHRKIRRHLHPQTTKKNTKKPTQLGFGGEVLRTILTWYRAKKSHFTLYVIFLSQSAQIFALYSSLFGVLLYDVVK
jgi:hypothetical protein